MRDEVALLSRRANPFTFLQSCILQVVKAIILAEISCGRSGIFACNLHIRVQAKNRPC